MELESADTIPAPSPFKVCGCGIEYTEEEWKKLPLAGIQKEDFEPDLELRHCRGCKSTIAIELRTEAA